MNRPTPGPSEEAGHYPQVVPLDAAAVWAEWEDRCVAVPKGQTTIAQRFNAGSPSRKERSPVRDDRRCFAHGMFSFAPPGLRRVCWPLSQR